MMRQWDVCSYIAYRRDCTREQCAALVVYGLLVVSLFYLILYRICYGMGLIGWLGRMVDIRVERKVAGLWRMARPRQTPDIITLVIITAGSLIQSTNVTQGSGCLPRTFSHFSDLASQRATFSSRTWLKEPR